MRRRFERRSGTVRLTGLVVIPLGLSGLVPGRPALAQAMADSTDRELLSVVEAALVAAAQAPEPWPGYDAAARPLLVYRVGGWSLLLNPPSSSPQADWVSYPESWPRLSRPAWLDPDGDPSLVGQLAFDYEIPGGLAVAVPMFEDLPAELGQRDVFLYSFLVHEAFHQFQRHHFSDVETPSEEPYPMLDTLNNALAGLELRALKDALELSGRGDSVGTREAAWLAMAVHGYRWDRLDETARAIERSKEVVEGTAKYVETRAVAAFAEGCRVGAAAELVDLCPLFVDLDAVRWLADDFDRRIGAGAIAPTDMPRNRIYPMAAAVALLLDVYEPGWKSTVEREGTQRGLFAHLTEALGTPDASRAELVDRARERYGWDGLVVATSKLVREYLAGFDQALALFEAEAGTRVVVRVPSNGLSRSRSSREQRWVVDAGRRTLGRFVAYTLRRTDEPKLELRIEDANVLDETRGDGYRTVTFHVRGPIDIIADGRSVGDETEGSRPFETLTFEADGAALRTDLAGTLTTQPGEVRVDVQPPGGG
jgi:hypothetical protein